MCSIWQNVEWWQNVECSRKENVERECGGDRGTEGAWAFFMGRRARQVALLHI